jgi:hypothetical protein
MTHAEVPTAQPPPDKGSWDWILKAPGHILGQFGFISIYGYPAILVGSFLVLGAAIAGRPYAELPLWMFFGIALYLPFLGYYLQPERIVERKFKLWDQWVSRKIITSNQRKEWKKELQTWYVEQTFRSLPRDGRLPPLISEEATNPQISRTT